MSVSMPPSIPPSPAPNSNTAGGSYCRFTGGRSSPPIDGVASLSLSGVEINLGANEPQRVWYYADLKTSEPIRPNAIDVLLSSSGEPGASLFVQGRDFAASLKDHAPHLSARAVARRGWHWALILAVILAATILASFAAGWSPIKSIAGALPDSWRQRLGDTARESMTEGHKQCVDPDGLAALARLTERLSKAAPVTKPFNVHVYDWSLMNAFAVPGGQIVLTKGLIDQAETSDEVAGVLAHEMGHGIEMHPETGMLRSIGLAAAVQVILGGGAGSGLANAGVMLAQLGYSREAEREADHHAYELLKGAAIAPRGLANFFVRVTKMESEDPDAANSHAFDWLRTHPSAAERAQLARQQPDYPSTPALDAQSWQELKSICNTTIEPNDKAEK
jgi:Zn-dependent protease with chaperone function